jgi:hypothetical protein
MTQYWQALLEQALIKKLKQTANEFADRTFRVVDIGIFPWHSSIELSFLFEEDDDHIDDIAAWKYYDYSQMNEDSWPEAKVVAIDLNKIWSHGCHIDSILSAVARVMASKNISDILDGFKKTSDFRVQILDPDDANSRNYANPQK